MSRLWVIFAWVLAACSYPALPRVGEVSDAGPVGTQGPPDAVRAPDAFVALDASSADAPVVSPTGFVPLYVLPASLKLGAPDLVLHGGTIDTDALTVGGATSAFFIRQDPYAILFTGVFAVEQPVTVQGASPLIVVASGHVNITASIDASAHADVAGPGATMTGAGHVGISFFDGGQAIRKSAGGGGGSYGSPGGVGGSENPQIAPGGAAGATYGGSVQDPLVGGAPGGLGGFAVGGSGGGGGGALQISSGDSIDIVLSTISVGGGGGVGGHTSLNGGSGGGAGGEIVLEAPTISFQASGQASLNALGGGGGAGGTQNGGGPPGGDGSDATAGGGGGAAGTPHSAAGGKGAAVTANALVDAQPGGGDAADGGGGGGGAGRIWLRYRASSPAPNANAAAPPAGLDPTLP